MTDLDATTGSPWTDEDVEAAAMALYDLPEPELDLTPTQLMRAVSPSVPSFADKARAVLDVLAPRVAELQRAAYDRGYQDGIHRGRRVVEDPKRFPIRRADYTTLVNPQRGTHD